MDGIVTDGRPIEGIMLGRLGRDGIATGGIATGADGIATGIDGVARGTNGIAIGIPAERDDSYECPRTQGCKIRKGFFGIHNGWLWKDSEDTNERAALIAMSI